jgi:hypothetical protein
LSTTFLYFTFLLWIFIFFITVYINRWETIFYMWSKYRNKHFLHSSRDVFR